VINHVRRGYRPRDTVLACDANGRLRPMPVSTHAQLRPELVVYRFNHSMYYANAHALSAEVLTLAAAARPRWLCVEMAAA